MKRWDSSCQRTEYGDQRGGHQANSDVHFGISNVLIVWKHPRDTAHRAHTGVDRSYGERLDSVDDAMNYFAEKGMLATRNLFGQ